LALTLSLPLFRKSWAVACLRGWQYGFAPLWKYGTTNWDRAKSS